MTLPAPSAFTRWSQRALFPQITFTAPTATSANPATRVVVREGGDPRNPADYVRQDTNVGSCPAGPAVLDCVPGSTLHKTNTNEQMDVHTPLEAKSLFVDGSYDITDNVRFRTTSLFHRFSDRIIAVYPMRLHLRYADERRQLLQSDRRGASPTGGAVRGSAAHHQFRPDQLPLQRVTRGFSSRERMSTGRRLSP